jgi:nitroreductase
MATGNTMGAMSAEEVLTTTRSVRRRLDLNRPVERAVVEACLRVAFQAPNGSNQQEWAWIVVDDPATRRAMSEIYRAAMLDVVARLPPVPDAEPVPGATSYERIRFSAQYLMDHLHEVPILVVPAIEADLANATVARQASRWGSILPAVWSLMLALRARGLGSAWTTLHLHRHEEMAELLGIPGGFTQAGLFPVAYTVGTTFRPADRSLSERTIHWNRW